MSKYKNENLEIKLEKVSFVVDDLMTESKNLDQIKKSNRIYTILRLYAFIFLLMIFR